ncbi:MAG: flagellar protein FlgN [Sideroxydans sp.]
MSLSPKDILQTIETERDALRSFVALLEREQQILLAPDTAPLLELVSEKTRMAETLSTSSKQRQQHFPAEPSAIEPWLGKNAPVAISAWHDLLRLAAHASQLNQSNGGLIQVRLRYNQQALHALISASQQAAGIYGPNGQPSMVGSGRTLGSG